MSFGTIKASIETEFLNNWAEAGVTYLMEDVPVNLDQFPEVIQSKFIPVNSVPYAFDGNQGRSVDSAQFQFKAYGKSSPRVYQIADSIITFLKGKSFVPDIYIDRGYIRGSAIKIENYYELTVIFPFNNYN